MSWSLLGNSLLVGSIATVGAITVGFLAALCAATLPRAMRVAAVAAAITSFMLPPFMVASCWIELLGNTGAWRPWLPVSIYSFAGAGWVLLLLLWPISFLLVLGEFAR